MNTKADIALTEFNKKYNEFLIACNDLEELGEWNIGELGLASAYFEADLFNVVLQVMSADGVFERSEAEVLNSMFSTHYTPRQLSQMYHSAKPVVEDYVSDDADDALALLAHINPVMRDRYRELLLEACRIVSMSDGVAEKSERMLIAQLREALS